MSLIVHPDFEKLKNQLSDLIYEYEELVNQICPSIEIKYVIRFGFLEYTLYKKEFEADKLKMRLRLIQKEINNQNEVDLEKIDKILADKFEEFEQRLKKSMDELNEKLRENDAFSPISEKDSAEIKKVYKKLIKLLHPDLNKNQSEFEKNLFIRATFAFKSGNLVELESILHILPNADFTYENETEKIESLIKTFEEKIKSIKDSYPYNKKELLFDEVQAEEYEKLLNDLIEARNSEIDRLTEKINRMII